MSIFDPLALLGIESLESSASCSKSGRRRGSATRRRGRAGVVTVEVLEARQYLSVSTGDTAEAAAVVGLDPAASLWSSSEIVVQPHGAPPSSTDLQLSVQSPVYGATPGIDATFRVTLSRAPGAGKSVAVNYMTKDGGAAAGIDYTATKGTLFFSGDETVKLVSVPIKAAALVGSPKPLTFSVVISGAVNAKITGDNAVTNIGPVLAGTMRSPVPNTYTPAQIRRAYGFDKIAADGAGTTIAIVDAYSSTNIRSDLAAFDRAFGLPDAPKFTIIDQNGGSQIPANNSGWSGEITLDVEWAHAIAPNANILLVCADSALQADLSKAVDTARKQPNVVVVSNSYGIPEQFIDASWLSAFDQNFVTPPNHNGVSFTVSTGDHGEIGAPAISARALAVGGTQLFVDKNNNYLGEVVWNDVDYTTGGGMSGIVAKPAFQAGVNTGGKGRGIPDVAFSARDVPVYQADAGGWGMTGGTSYSSPMWAGLIALADGIRMSRGLDSLANVQEVVYQLPRTDFHDITIGDNSYAGKAYPSNNGGYSAKPGYDLVSGLGTPLADRVINDLANFTGTTTSPAAIQPGKSSQPANLKRLVSPHIIDPVWVPTAFNTDRPAARTMPADAPKDLVFVAPLGATEASRPGEARGLRRSSPAIVELGKSPVRAAAFASLARH